MTGITKGGREKGDSSALYQELVNLLNSDAPGGIGRWFNIIGISDTTSSRTVLLEATEVVDPVQNTAFLNGRAFTDTGAAPTPPQPWHIQFVGKKNASGDIIDLRVYWGTPNQLQAATLPPDPGTPFINLWDEGCYPQAFLNVFSYRLTIMRRGIALSMWRNNQVNSVAAGNTLLVIQRPVRPGGVDAGKYRTTGRIPLFSLDIEAGRDEGQEFQFTVVREEDVTFASPKRNIGIPNYFSLYGNTLGWMHPNILSNTTHVIKIPFGLCTDRHIYMEEMDMVSLTQATCFIVDQKVEIEMYSQDREYTCTWGPVSYSYKDTRQVLGGSRINILTAVNKDDPTGPDYITVVP